MPSSTVGTSYFNAFIEIINGANFQKTLAKSNTIAQVLYNKCGTLKWDYAKLCVKIQNYNTTFCRNKSNLHFIHASCTQRMLDDLCVLNMDGAENEKNEEKMKNHKSVCDCCQLHWDATPWKSFPEWTNSIDPKYYTDPIQKA